MERSTSMVKSTWPGVSMMLMRWPSHSHVVAADVMVIKAAPLGGISRAIDLVAQVGLPAVVSSALETSVGLAMGAYLAAALPDTFDAGLGTASLLAADITHEPLSARDGSIDVRRVVPDSDLLDAHAAGDERTAWWFERIARCHHILEAAD
jgi:O-succinylbenzoate synthase